jgi:acylphosphatase
MTALMAMSGRTPLFAADEGTRYTGPFNAGGQYGPLLEIIMPSIMQMMLGSEHMPAQFFPEQNLYEQFEANKFFGAQQQAMQVASRRDTGTLTNMFNGLTQMMTGKGLTDMQQSRNTRIAGGISQYMPLLTQVLGPDLIDQLHGSRGSATVFAQQFHQAMRTGVDPIAHTVGYSGQSSGRVTQEVFENLFGQNADLGMMKGMSAGQAGILLNELQARGVLGKPMGLRPLDEQRSILPRVLTPDAVNRIAEQLPEVQAILRDGGTPNEDVLAAARAEVRKTQSRLVDPAEKLTQDDLEEMPGAQDIIRSGDAARITSRLKNLSGAVKAMRDIFGDMGNPNAPMRELINGLDALTQGGLATMSPGQIEMMVRKTHTLAKQTGIGVEGMMGLMAQNADLADKLGLDRSFAVTAAQQAAAFGAAAGDNLRLDIPVWGALTKEQLMLGDQQLRMHAASSPLANQMNTLMRMSDAGMIQPAAGTELAAMTEAIRTGKTKYEFDGRQRDIAMPHAQLVRLLKEEAGVNETEAYSILQDIKGNQEFGQRYNTTDTIRRIQTDETVRRMLTPALGSRMRNMMEEEGIGEIMQAQGLVQNDTEFREMMSRVGQGLGNDFLSLDAETVRSPTKKRQAMGQAIKQRLTNEVRSRMPDANPDEINTIVNNMVEQIGGERGLENMGQAVIATINQTAGRHPVFKSDVGLHNTLNQDVMKQAASRERQAEMAAMTQSALAGLGTADPVRRLADVFQSAGPETTIQDVLSTALGGISIDEVKAADPGGGLAKVFDLLQDNKQLDPTDPTQLEQARRNAAVIRGLVEGGEVAHSQLQMLDASRVTIEADAVDTATPAQQDRAVASLERMDTREQKLRDAKLTNQQSQITQASNRLSSIQAGLTPEDQRGASERVVSTTVRAMAASLGEEEIILGGNRFLTSRGIVTKDPDGNVASVAGFDDMATAKTTLDVLQQRHNQAVAKAAESDQVRKAETSEQKLQRAADGGMLRGELTIGNERLYEQLRNAEKRDSDTSILGDFGYQLHADVSTNQIKAINDVGRRAGQILKDDKVTKDERDSLMTTYVTGAHSRAVQLLTDERSMRIIGQGGLDLVNSAMSQSTTLKNLAAQESERLGKTITVADLLRGDDGVSPAIVKQAQESFQTMETNWGEIEQRRGYGMLPGKGDAENKKRSPMTEQEIEDVKAQTAFMRENTTAEARAADVLDRMMSIATPEQRDRMGADVNRQQLMAALTDGDRSVSLDRALHSRQELLEMALKKGAFAGKTKLTELTDEDELVAAERLQSLGLTSAETADVARLRRDAAPLMDFGMEGMSAGDITQDALKRIQQSSSRTMPATDTQERELKVTVNGTVKQLDDGRVDLSLEGKGLMDQVANILGMV